MEEETLQEPLVELKRAEHLLHVSLKYTRTGDVIISLVERVAAAIDKTMDILYEFKGIKDVPSQPIPKANMIKEEFPDDEMIGDVMDFFIELRKVLRHERVSSNEFRRTLNVEVKIPGEDSIMLDIDKMYEFYEKTENFLKHVTRMVKED